MIWNDAVDLGPLGMFPPHCISVRAARNPSSSSETT
jgi:hypothetical protein